MLRDQTIEEIYDGFFIHLTTWSLLAAGIVRAVRHAAKTQETASYWIPAICIC